MKIQLIAIMLLLLSNINGKELDNVFQLVPTPQKIEVEKQENYLSRRIKQVSPDKERGKTTRQRQMTRFC